MLCDVNPSLVIEEKSGISSGRARPDLGAPSELEVSALAQRHSEIAEIAPRGSGKCSDVKRRSESPSPTRCSASTRRLRSCKGGVRVMKFSFSQPTKHVRKTHSA